AGAADAVVLDVLPDPFVGVELRGVGGQDEDLDLAAGGLDELGVTVTPLSRAPMDGDDGSSWSTCRTMWAS
ncbi:MAG: hypothetical protein ACRDQ7_14010, partial [Haloechinothrix sp.]